MRRETLLLPFPGEYLKLWSCWRKGGTFRPAVTLTQVIEKYKEFAFSDNARVGRALTLYEVGNRNDAIAEMEDVSISLKGYPEVVARRIEDLMMEKRRQERAFIKMGSSLSAQRMRRSGRC
ncbi:hypothetical protein ACLB2K_001928 [Fragaria x ananassa]